MQELPWVKDTLTEAERETLDTLLYIGARNIEHLAAIVSMPFLDSLDDIDVLAIQGMDRLSRSDLLSGMLANPTLQEGISDSSTVLVAAAATLKDAEAIEQLLLPGYALVETADIGTRMTPGLKASIVRAGDHAEPWTAGTVQSAAEFIEETMQDPLPVNHVIVVLHDDAVFPYAAGVNYGFAISYQPEYEREEDSYEGHILRSGLAHEIAHYYWRGNVAWLDEGLAELVSGLFGEATGIWPVALQNTRRGCEAQNLEMLTEWDPHQGSPSYRCTYFLGQWLFEELAQDVGKDAIGGMLRNLYRLSLAEQMAGVEAVRAAFVEQPTIIERHWSGDTNLPANRTFLRETRSHNLIQWDEPPAVDRSGFVKFSGNLLNNAELSRSISEARDRMGYPNFTIFDARGYVGTILYPPESGREWDLSENSRNAEPFEYVLYSTSFRVGFRFPPSIDNPTDHYVVAWGFRDEKGMPYIGNEADILGIAKIEAK